MVLGASETKSNEKQLARQS